MPPDGIAVRPGALVPSAKVMRRGSLFDRFANRAARFAGHPLAFVAAVLLILVWILAGPLFGYSDTWQLVINTTTTIVTFLMVFVIQNTQNRDGHATQVKLDELIRSVEGAHNGLLDIEELSEAELLAFRDQYAELAKAARDEIRRDVDDTGSPRIEFPGSD
jgi:low affinity Fe/Cu permease